MKLTLLPEPELQFGAGRHIDIRFGIKDYGPLDFGQPSAPREIRLGIIGTPHSTEKLKEWLSKCRQGVQAKPSPKPNLFPRFPGFSSDSPFKCALVHDSRFERMIPERTFEQIAKRKTYREVVAAATEAFEVEIENLTQNTPVDVIVCALPTSLIQILLPVEGEQEDREDGAVVQKITKPATSSLENPDFHHLLKAKAMRFRKPIQLIQPYTYGDAGKKPTTARQRRLQDEATRAWNFHVALYYKANGIPWRMIREQSELTTCFVGISFYRNLSGDRLLTSIAQVFSERGEGIIIRGGTATQSKDDRQPHLDEESSRSLLKQAIERYRSEHMTTPARVVIHKSSSHSEQETSGFQAALAEQRIDIFDLVSMGRNSARLFRLGAYPPLRGTFLSLDESIHVLYTRGSIDFYRTYPGLYVPKPIKFRCDRIDSTPQTLAKEILALTKMNWNNTQFDNSEPITLHAARQVGDILKYVGPSDVPEPRYGYYM